MELKRYKLLGVEINPMTIEDLHTLISDAIVKNRKIIIASQNLHSIYLHKKNSALQALQKAAYLRVDGMPLVMWGRILGLPLTKLHRVTWVDWIMPFIENVCKEHWKLFYLGSSSDVAKKGTLKLLKIFPSLRIDFSEGYFDMSKKSDENMSRIRLIRDADPDILMVGMGMPRQEQWIIENVEYLSARVILTCGAAMEYVAGVVSNPPRWMGMSGLEWTFRMLENPKRFWKRYLIEPWTLIPNFLHDIVSMNNTYKKQITKINQF